MFLCRTSFGEWRRWEERWCSKVEKLYFFVTAEHTLRVKVSSVLVLSVIMALKP